MKLLEVILVSLFATAGVTAAYSLSVLGVARSAEARREGHHGLVWAALAVVALLVFAGGVVFGVHVMLAKS